MIRVMLILLLITPSMSLADELPYDFRNVRWGMSQDEVIKSEISKPIARDEDGIAYKAEIAGMDATLFYSFYDKQLVSAHYLLTGSHADPDLYLQDYERVKVSLSKNNGEPGYGKKATECVWSDDKYKNDPKNKGAAVAQGMVDCGVKWEKETTHIILYISGGGKGWEPSVNVIYRHPTLGTKINDKIKLEILKGTL